MMCTSCVFYLVYIHIIYIYTHCVYVCVMVFVVVDGVIVHGFSDRLPGAGESVVHTILLKDCRDVKSID